MNEAPFDITQTASANALQAFSEFLQEVQDEVGFKVSARGWCYQLEQLRVINKDQFDKAESWINRCRKRGILPIDFVAEEPAREFQGVEEPDTMTPGEHAVDWLEAVLETERYYTPDWWDGESFYIQMVVEKIDLITLFEPVCSQYHIPIATSKGWGSMLQRAEYARRFKEAEDRGLECVLLYCGDHDPDGLRISDFLRSNLGDLKNIRWGDGDWGYDPCDLIIERFGLEMDFIERHDLTWIDNLVTGSGKNLASPSHKNHGMPYVQQYLRDVGERKCEANALVTMPPTARRLCADAIEDYLGDDARDRFRKKREAVAEEMNDLREKTGLTKTINNAIALFRSQGDNE